jgi:EpsI family protein
MKYRKFIYLLLFFLLSYLILLLIKTENIEIKNNLINAKIEIEGWRYIRDIGVDDWVLDDLEAQALIYREFRNNINIPLSLVVIYHINKRWGAHDPIVCYKSQGWDVIEEINNVNIKGQNQTYAVNRFIVRKEGNLELVYYYWFSSNKKITSSRKKQMLDMIIHGIIHGFAESGFVRISIPIKENNIQEAVLVINDFTEKFTMLLKNIL